MARQLRRRHANGGLAAMSHAAVAAVWLAGCGASGGDPVGTTSAQPAVDGGHDGTDAGRSRADAIVDASMGTVDAPTVWDAAGASPDAPQPTDAGVAVLPDAPVSLDGDSLTPDGVPDGGPPAMDAGAAVLAIGGTARVTASALNLRAGAGTSNPVLTSMACGARVTLVGGPSGGWWNITYMATTGWSSGAYLVPESAFDPSLCMAPPAMGADAGTTTPPSMPGEVAAIFSLAGPAVGYSYYWGHGSWGTDGLNHGSCAGSCPSCTHTGRYGADCSGFVAKVWQVPGPSAVTTDAHPYSTVDFYNSRTHWTEVSRTAVHPADALTYNSGGAGHIMLFESGSDPWGSIWTYEARGCATGIVHNLRTAGTAYITIRREGL